MKSFATEKNEQLDDIAVSGTRRHSRAADIWLRLVRDRAQWLVGAAGNHYPAGHFCRCAVR